MSQLVEVLYPVPDFRRTPWSMLRWWESRRPLFNAAVGAAGVVTLGAVYLFASLPPHPATIGGAILVGAAVYGVLANVCYTFGWGIEMAARLVWGRRAPAMGPLLFRQGLIFSVGVTLLPVLIAVLSWIVRIVVSITT